MQLLEAIGAVEKPAERGAASPYQEIVTVPPDVEDEKDSLEEAIAIDDDDDDDASWSLGIKASVRKVSACPESPNRDI